MVCDFDVIFQFTPKIMPSKFAIDVRNTNIKAPVSKETQDTFISILELLSLFESLHQGFNITFAAFEESPAMNFFKDLVGNLEQLDQIVLRTYKTRGGKIQHPGALVI